jgi:hypothetical protein
MAFVNIIKIKNSVIVANHEVGVIKKREGDDCLGGGRCLLAGV